MSDTPEVESTKVSELKRQLAAEREHGKLLQGQVDAFLRPAPLPADARAGMLHAADLCDARGSSYFAKIIRADAATLPNIERQVARMKYDNLDMAILKAIDNGIKTFTAIAYRVDELAKPHARQMTQTFRVVDRRLQALRKKGRIRFENKEWSHGFRISATERSSKT